VVLLAMVALLVDAVAVSVLLALLLLQSHGRGITQATPT
jgi:hypothetical protein